MCVCHKSKPGPGPTYGAHLHRRGSCAEVDLPGGGGHAEARQEHWPGGTRVQVRDAVCGGDDGRITHNSPTAQVCS